MLSYEFQFDQKKFVYHHFMIMALKMVKCSETSPEKINQDLPWKGGGGVGIVRSTVTI